MRVKRVFIAINIPNEIKEKIWKVVSEKIPTEGIKRVEMDNLHVTLLFLGYLTENSIKEIAEKLMQIEKQGCFEIALNGIGHFGSRVLWLGVTKGAEKAARIHDKICEILQIRDARFSAHVTLARNKRLSGREFFTIVENLERKQFAFSFKVRTIDIMESILNSSGPVYKKLAEIRLAA